MRMHNNVAAATTGSSIRSAISTHDRNRGHSVSQNNLQNIGAEIRNRLVEQRQPFHASNNEISAAPISARRQTVSGFNPVGARRPTARSLGDDVTFPIGFRNRDFRPGYGTGQSTSKRQALDNDERRAAADRYLDRFSTSSTATATTDTLAFSQGSYFTNSIIITLLIFFDILLS